jgi:hypothetical protein
MKYALLIYTDEQFFGTEEGRSALPGFAAGHMAFMEKLGDKRFGNFRLKGSGTATTVRSDGGAKTIHDGPYPETKEHLGGVYLIDVADLDAAIAAAQESPTTPNGAIEIRPLMEMG